MLFIYSNNIPSSDRNLLQLLVKHDLHILFLLLHYDFGQDY